ncbi:hypothetical protein EYF80_049241 [Liparis tanakae]|uniref:Uncharacterized protein n=1 Tax=Liparis tanakae TaxID=230148 RepID=A0A4Z2FJW9_9TELE|nr:hypothetical protein EYF80_049241 [Liparis tanakae]
MLRCSVYAGGSVPSLEPVTAHSVRIERGGRGGGESRSTVGCTQSAPPADRLMSRNQPPRSDWAMLWR